MRKVHHLKLLTETGIISVHVDESADIKKVEEMISAKHGKFIQLSEKIEILKK
jgi:hypothetical protein